MYYQGLRDQAHKVVCFSVNVSHIGVQTAVRFTKGDECTLPDAVKHYSIQVKANSKSIASQQRNACKVIKT